MDVATRVTHISEFDLSAWMPFVHCACTLHSQDHVKLIQLLTAFHRPFVTPVECLHSSFTKPSRGGSQVVITGRQTASKDKAITSFRQLIFQTVTYLSLEFLLLCGDLPVVHSGVKFIDLCRRRKLCFVCRWQDVLSELFFGYFRVKIFQFSNQEPCPQSKTLAFGLRYRI